MPMARRLQLGENSIGEGLEKKGNQIPLATKSQLLYFASAMSRSVKLPSPIPGCPHPALCPLNRMRAGTAARIKRLSASPEVSHRLRELGFCEDQAVRMLSQESNIICEVCNVRLGLSAQLAETILVEPIEAPVDR